MATNRESMMNDFEKSVREILDGEIEASPVNDECGSCEQETPHYTQVYMVKEGDGENADMSKEPYLASVCVECEETRFERGGYL